MEESQDKKKMLTSAEVKKQRRVLRDLAKLLDEKRKAIFLQAEDLYNQMILLQKSCPHRKLVSHHLFRECADCGYTKDTYE